MRITLILGLLLMLVAAPVAQAQQVTAPARDARQALPVVEAPSLTQQADSAPVSVEAVRSTEEAGEAARREMSARNLLAIVGGAIVVVALIVLLR